MGFSWIVKYLFHFMTANVSETAKLFQTTTKKVKEKFWKKNIKVWKRLYFILWKRRYRKNAYFKLALTLLFAISIFSADDYNTRDTYCSSPCPCWM